MKGDPCLECPLPDCDDTDKRCLLKRASSKYQQLMKRREDVPAVIRNARNAHFAIWKLEHEAIISETVS